MNRALDTVGEIQHGKRRSEIGTHGIRINCEDILVEGRVDTDNVTHLMINLKFQGRHRCVEVHSVQIMQQEDLRVALPAIARF